MLESARRDGRRKRFDRKPERRMVETDCWSEDKYNRSPFIVTYFKGGEIDIFLNDG